MFCQPPNGEFLVKIPRLAIQFRFFSVYNQKLSAKQHAADRTWKTE
jgi:hypothetical protein